MRAENRPKFGAHFLFHKREIRRPNWRCYILLLAVTISGCTQKSTPRDQATSRPAATSTVVASWVPPSTDGYVGSDSCAQCHQNIADTFRLHPMANSIRSVNGPPAGSTVSSGNASQVDGMTRFYEVRCDADGQMFHHEKMVDLEGQTIFDQAVPMHFEVGSGQRAFAYLYQQNDLLFQSPINWYSKTQQWDLSPGYTKDDPRRFRRRITDECLACHAGKTAPKGRSLDRFDNPVFHEMSIGCENCHGPGAQHIALHEHGRLVEGAMDPIVNPANLHHSARESVCNQCHLQATARIPRPGRSHFDFRPGQELESIWTVLDKGVEVSDDGQTRAVNHVQQMRASQCYIGSKGALGCVSCHDPHVHPDESVKEAFYRSRCLECHQSDACSETQPVRQQNNDSCVACHMPHRESNNISHVTQTDHRVIRQPSAASPVSTQNEAELTLNFFDQANQRMELWEAQRASAAAIWMYLDKKGKPAPTSLARLLTPALKAAPDDHLTLTLLGALANEHGRRDMATEYFESARKLPAGEESAVSGLLTIYYLASRWKQALECADRMIEINPGEARFHTLRADILKNLNRLDEGIMAAKRSLQLDPTVLPLRQWLIDNLKEAGRESESKVESQSQILERMRRVIDSRMSATVDSKTQESPAP